MLVGASRRNHFFLTTVRAQTDEAGLARLFRGRLRFEQFVRDGRRIRDSVYVPDVDVVRLELAQAGFEIVQRALLRRRVGLRRDV